MNKDEAFEAKRVKEAAARILAQEAEIGRLIAKLLEGVGEPVMRITVGDGVCISTRSANFKHIGDGPTELYTAEQLAAAVLAERIKERNALAEVCEAMGAPEIAKYLREQAAIRGATT